MFFSDEDRRAYLDWMHEYCAKQEVDILTHCLMRNRVHVVAVPPEETAFEKVFRPLHTRYAQRINRAKDSAGI